jgi:hypothetical protein
MSIIKDLKRPINTLSLAIGLLSIIVSLLLYFASLKSPKPVFLIDDQRGKIFDSKIASPAIKVLDKESSLIEQDVYIVTLAFWNSGEQPIEPESIRKNIQLKISPIERLLDFSILKQVDPEISKIKLKAISPSEIEISWAHLDPGYGARLQLIYIGDEDAQINFSGKIIGAEITNAKPLGEKFKNFETIITGLLGALIANIIFSFRDLYVAVVKNDGRTAIARRSLISVFILGLAIFLYIFVIKGPTPPI